MPTDTDTSGLTQEDILGKLNEELGMPSKCLSHPSARVRDTFFEKGVPVFVTMTCSCRLIIKPESSRGKHRWHRE